MTPKAAAKLTMRLKYELGLTSVAETNLKNLFLNLIALSLCIYYYSSYIQDSNLVPITTRKPKIKYVNAKIQ